MSEKVKKATLLPLLLGIRSNFVAFHHWKEAPFEVAFLRHPHRHVFNVTLRMSVPSANVTSVDRYFEFFIVKKALDAFLDQWRDQTLVFSCEMFAFRICNWALERYKLDECSVTVQEDGENFATYKGVGEERD